MTQKQIERRTILVGIIANLLSTIAGIFIFMATNIQALFIDCFFSFIAFLSSVTAFIISKASKKKTKHYPNGLHFLEPLYAIFKSLLTLILFISAIYSSSQVAWNYFTYGIGEPMNTAPVLPYTMALVVLCFAFSFFTKYQNKKINNTSTILAIETKTSFIDGLQSFAIGVGVILLNMVDINGTLGFLHYTGDFFVTVFLVLTSLKEPLQEFIIAFRELTCGTTSDKEIEKNISKTVDKYRSNSFVLEKYKIVKTGMYISVFLYLNSETVCDDLPSVKQNMLKELQPVYENIEITFCQ